MIVSVNTAREVYSLFPGAGVWKKSGLSHAAADCRASSLKFGYVDPGILFKLLCTATHPAIPHKQVLLEKFSALLLEPAQRTLACKSSPYRFTRRGLGSTGIWEQRGAPCTLRGCVVGLCRHREGSIYSQIKLTGSFICV